ncbi:hypothetical protein ACXYX3_21735 [Mycobacterium sp. C3-094]
MKNASPEIDLDAEYADEREVSEPLPNSVQTTSSDLRRRRRRRHRRRPWAPAARWRGNAALVLDRATRLRLLIWIVIGLALLGTSRWLQHDASLFAAPTTATGWVALACGLGGLWLVPGQWMSALMMRTGAGLPAWLGTRISTTLAWYALVGPVIHHFGEGAQVTTNGILIATCAASGAVAVGVLLGLSRWPARRWQRLLLSAAVGAAGAQIVIVMTMRLWTYDMNYAHIRRLDWLIVLGAAVLVTMATLIWPIMQPARTPANVRGVLASVVVLVGTAAALSFVDAHWSPEQQMPSAFAVEQIPAPADADVALSLTGIGAEGPQMVRDARFAVFDITGRELPAQLRITNGTLLVTLLEGSRQLVCRPGSPPKVTLRDGVSGVRAQAVVRDGWCPR